MHIIQLYNQFNKLHKRKQYNFNLIKQKVQQHNLMCRPAEEVREDILLSWPMPHIYIILVQLQTPTQQLLVMGGHTPQKL